MCVFGTEQRECFITFPACGVNNRACHNINIFAPPSRSQREPKDLRQRATALLIIAHYQTADDISLGEKYLIDMSWQRCIFF